MFSTVSNMVAELERDPTNFRRRRGRTRTACSNQRRTENSWSATVPAQQCSSCESGQSCSGSSSANRVLRRTIELLRDHTSTKLQSPRGYLRKETELREQSCSSHASAVVESCTVMRGDSGVYQSSSSKRSVGVSLPRLICHYSQDPLVHSLFFWRFCDLVQFPPFPPLDFPHFLLFPFLSGFHPPFFQWRDDVQLPVQHWPWCFPHTAHNETSLPLLGSNSDTPWPCVRIFSLWHQFTSESVHWWFSWRTQSIRSTSRTKFDQLSHLVARSKRCSLMLLWPIPDTTNFNESLWASQVIVS